MRSIKLKILKTVKDLKLDLRGKIVLTEAATGAYAVTPIIAAAAGAKVFAYTRNSKFGTIEEVKYQTLEIAKLFDDLNIEIIDELTSEILSTADIITNSGHLRPINQDFLKQLKRGAVIPYMYEAWEFRDVDLDLGYCKKNDIIVGATNERHPNIDVFNYLGELAVKLIHDAGMCLYNNKFIIISNNDFGYHIAKTLVKLCKCVGVVDIEANKSKYPDEIEWLSSFPVIRIPDSFKEAEGVIFTAYPFDNVWIKDCGIINLASLSTIEDLVILRFAGDLDPDFLDKHNISYFPKFVQNGHMGLLLSEIGNDSIIRLQAGGLKVGQLLLENKLEFNNIQMVELL
jgi:hypothetical protein